MLKKALLAGVVSSAMLFTTACGGGGSESSDSGKGKPDTLVVVDWGGDITKAREKTIFEPFEEKFNVKINVETPTDTGKFKAMVDSGNVTWDVVNVGNDWLYTAGKDGLLESLDYDIISQDEIIPGNVDEFGLGAEMYSTVIAYNTETFSEENHPKTWADFWDVEKFPGKRALWNLPMETLEIALLADGVSPDELYPLDVDRAFASLDKLKEKTDIVWWDSGAQPVELISTGTVTMSSAWNGRITEAKSDGAPVDLEYNQGILGGESWVIPKGSKNKELAMEFINFATSAVPQAEFAKSIDYAPVNQKAIDSLPEEVREKLGQSEEKAQNQVMLNSKWWADYYEEINNRFMEWRLK